MNGIYVSGTYTPIGNYYFECVLQDGATLDISELVLPFPLTSSLVFVQTATDEQKLARKTVRLAILSGAHLRFSPSLLCNGNNQNNFQKQLSPTGTP